MSDDFSELYELAADLEEAPANLAPNLGKALGVTSGKIQKDARKSVRGRNKRFRQAAADIDYELTGTSGDVSEMSSEIGYQKGGAGNLGTWLEYGAPGAENQIAPSHDLGNALLNNEEDFEQGVQKAVDDSLREANL